MRHQIKAGKISLVIATLIFMSCATQQQRAERREMRGTQPYAKGIR